MSRTGTKYTALLLSSVLIATAVSADEFATAGITPAAGGEAKVLTSTGGDAVVETGDGLISLDLKGIDIHALFRLLSMKTGRTIVLSQNVRGRVTLFLSNVTFEDALDVILITQGLASEKRGDIIMISTADEYRKRRGQSYDELRKIVTYILEFARPGSVLNVLNEVKSEIGRVVVNEERGMLIVIDVPEKIEIMDRLIHELDKPLETAVYDLQYAESSAVKSHVDSMLTSGTGSALIDERSDLLVVSDMPERMKQIDRVVKAVDREPLEVLIEAEVWQIVLRDEYQKGINWERIFSADILHGQPDVTVTGSFPVYSSGSPSPALGDNNQLQVSVGTMAANGYSATFNLLQNFGDVKIISRPKIAVMDKEEARIMVGTREAYVTQTQSQGETTVTSENVEFIDVGVKLNVTPWINEDGMITMHIKPEVSSVPRMLTTSLGSEIPIVETSEAETRVKVKDGRMIVIGGLLKEEKRKDMTAVPWASRLPVVGGLFRSRADLRQNTELVFLITPHIITGRESMIYRDTERVGTSMIKDGGRSPIAASTADVQAASMAPDPIQRKLKDYNGI